MKFLSEKSCKKFLNMGYIYLFLEKFSDLKNPIEVALISRNLLKNPNYSIVFFSVLPEEFWTILTVEVNKNLARLKPSKKIQ